jgi:CelD/BcsL family acetyltransferase involved in cellulose biosynthesis
MVLTRAQVRLASPPIQLREVTTLSQFDALASEWNALVDRLDLPSPFQSWEWNRTWWNHFGAGRALQILEFRRGGRLIGLAPFFRRRLGKPALGLSMLLPLGWEGGGRANGLSEQWELLFPAVDRMALLESLAGWLKEHHWSTVLIPGFGPDDLMPSWIRDRIAYRGKGVIFDYRRVPASWEALVQSLNKSMRDNVRYYPRLMERKGHPYRYEIAATPAEISAALPILFNLHRERAESTLKIAHDNYFEYPNRRAFIREVTPLLAEQGQIRIGIARINNEPVAVQMWLEHGETMFLYYSGFLPKWSPHSVALLATIGAFQDGLKRGIRQIEFLAGGGHPKERWDTSQRVHSNIWLVRHPAMTRLLFALPIHYKRLA